jgi:fatty acid desaturase
MRRGTPGGRGMLPAEGAMADRSFVRRDELAALEWDNQRKDWIRPPVDRDTLRELTERNTLNGLVRVLYFMVLLAGAAVGAVLVARGNAWLALPFVYVYFFLYGFWVAIAHELQHKTVFARSQEWLNEALFYLVQTLMWNSPTYARVSHKLHHRYTMVRGYDPETDWPEVITRTWLRRHVLGLVLRMLVVGAVYDLIRSVQLQVRRALGREDWMIRDHCTPAQKRAIRWESLMILVVHATIVVIAVVFRTWELLVFITIAWQIGSAFERLWHDTKHIARPYNVKDHRLNTRSVKVGWFIRSFFWGLDDHVDHHLYPAVPSRNLKKLHRILEPHLPEPDTVFGCWVEMFEIAKEKTSDPAREYLAVRPSPVDSPAPSAEAAPFHPSQEAEP